MKLYNGNLSNFASKCRLAVYEKKADVNIVPIPGGDLKAPEYLKIYPMGKIPALEVDGEIIGESEVINEFLEETFPDPPLLPRDPRGRARVRSITRFHDLYLEPPLRALFPQASAKERDAKLIAEKLGEFNQRLDQLESRLSGGPYAVENVFTFADCALVPTFFFANLMLPMLGSQPFTVGRPRLARWWEEVQKRATVQQVLGEQQQALMERMKQQA